MTKYDKVWIEVDVDKLDVDQDSKKTKVLAKIMESLASCDVIKNVTKLTYQIGFEKRE